MSANQNKVGDYWKLAAVQQLVYYWDSFPELASPRNLLSRLPKQCERAHKTLLASLQCDLRLRAFWAHKLAKCPTAACELGAQGFRRVSEKTRDQLRGHWPGFSCSPANAWHGA
ncbi:unnamed protein product [Effrenium voratum]|nr:unnamed protein product [Effrenium voratum]